MKLFDLSLQLSGFPIKKAQKHFAEILSIPESEYAAYIEQKKAEIVHFHLQNNSFYRELCKDKNVDNWNDLPVLTKADLQQPLCKRLSDGYTEKNVFINKTSGSSGNPFVFAKDKYCHAMIWSSIRYRFGMYGINLNTSYQARFYGYPLEFFNRLKLKFKDFLCHRFRFPLFDLSDASLAKFVHLFRKKRFDYINGYTTSIVLLCKYLEKENIILKNICPSLKVCIVTSEMLFDDDKKLLEKWLGIPIVNEYGAAEMDIIAFQNINAEWIVNTENLFIEILDDDNNPLPYGKEGNITITSLYNKAHPFIRYKIGDIGILEKINTKKIILKKLIGRTNDYAQLPSGRKAPGMTFYSLTKAIMQEDGSLKEFIVKQTEIDTFEIHYVSDNTLSEEQLLFMKQKLSSYLENGLHFKFIRSEKLERNKSGKLKQFISLIK